MPSSPGTSQTRHLAIMSSSDADAAAYAELFYGLYVASTDNV